MNETPITAEDLTLYAMHLLDSAASGRVELLLRSSTEARQELALIRGDLAVFAMSAQQHTPPALSRQRLLKQVAREQRTVPITVAMQDAVPFAVDTPVTPVTDPSPAPQRAVKSLAEERRSKVRLPRIISEPEPISTNDTDMPDAGPAVTPLPAEVGPALPRPASLPGSATSAVRAGARDDAGKRTGPAALPKTIPDELPEDRYEPSAGIPSIRYSKAAPVRQNSRVGAVVSWAGWVTAAGLAAAGAFVFHTNLDLRQRLDKQSAALVRSSAAAETADVLLQTLQSPAAQRFVLARQDTAPVPAARVAYLPARGSLVFQGTNLDPLAAYKTYELWLIPSGEGRQPIAAGIFKPDTRGYATLVLPKSLPKGTVAGNFGVTVEDDGGSAAPTLPILLIGQQG